MGSHDALFPYAHIADVPDEEGDEQPCRIALHGELPVADVAIIAGVVLRLRCDVDAVDRVEEDRHGDGKDLKPIEHRARDEIHHGERVIERLRPTQHGRVRKDVLEEEHADDDESDQ